ncbi:MAG: SCO family protein [Rhizobiaceae bacterium]
MTLTRLRFALWVLVAVVVAVTAVFMLRQTATDEQQVGKVVIGGPFSMTNQLGQPVTEKDYSGLPMAMFFGFTNCPDICPTVLLRMTDLMVKLGPDADKLQVVLVSVDPERDTPDVLKSYLEQFDSRFSAMTGTPEQLAAFAKGYRFVYKKVPLTGGDYTMDHSAGVFLYEAKGAFVGTLDPHEEDAVVLAKLMRLLQ